MSQYSIQIYFLLFVMALYFFDQSQLYKLKYRQEQLIPHTFLNSLTFLQSALIKNEYQNAIGYFDYQTSYLKKVVTAKAKIIHSLHQEIEDAHLFVQYFNAVNNVAFQLNVKIENKSNTEILVPTLLLQPFIENIFKHTKTKASVINVQVIINNSFFNKISTISIQLNNNELYNKNVSITKKTNGLYIAQNRLQYVCSITATNSFYENGISIKKSNNNNIQVTIHLPSSLQGYEN